MTLRTRIADVEEREALKKAPAEHTIITLEVSGITGMTVLLNKGWNILGIVPLNYASGTRFIMGIDRKILEERLA